MSWQTLPIWEGDTSDTDVSLYPIGNSLLRITCQQHTVRMYTFIPIQNYACQIVWSYTPRQIVPLLVSDVKDAKAST